MKTLNEVSPEKLRGGFYTPEPLVQICLDRIDALTAGQKDLRILEPSAGDGAFLRSLPKHMLADRVRHFTAIEVVEVEAAKCRTFALDGSFHTQVINTSALDWAITNEEMFDVAMGNPPFVRFQFVPKGDVWASERLVQRLGLPFRGVANLWIPILLAGVSHLREGGAFAFVVPAEIFTGLSAGDVRTWLLRNVTSLHIDMFDPGSFPGVLQEIVVISGTRACANDMQLFSKTAVVFEEHADGIRARRFSHSMDVTSTPWTKFLLTPSELEAFDFAGKLETVKPFGNVAKLEVSIVTGANDFFSVNTHELDEYELSPWAEPLLPRIRHANGLTFTDDDHAATAALGAKAWLLNFDKTRPDPISFGRPSDYLSTGISKGIPNRYKTSIRTPWYRVPSIRAGKLMLSKRSHWYPRLVLNTGGVLTTDTIYRGIMRPTYKGQEASLVASFHNSLTLLSAEIEGRSFGGGVLELVPSEIARLRVPFNISSGKNLPQLDCLVREIRADSARQDMLIESTNMMLQSFVKGWTPELVDMLESARRSLMSRRIGRNQATNKSIE